MRLNNARAGAELRNRLEDRIRDLCSVLASSDVPDGEIIDAAHELRLLVNLYVEDVRKRLAINPPPIERRKTAFLSGH